MAEVTGLLIAIAWLLSVLLAAAVVVIATWKPHLLPFFKWKYGGLEAEVRGAIAKAAEETRVTANANDAVAQIPLAVAEEADAPEGGRQSSSVPEETTKPESAFELLVKERKYDEALAQVRRAVSPS